LFFSPGEKNPKNRRGGKGTISRNCGLGEFLRREANSGSSAERKTRKAGLSKTKKGVNGLFLADKTRKP